MKKALRKDRFGNGLLSFGLSLLLVTALISPAAAVVFTNPAPITINDATTIASGSVYPSNISVSGLTGNITDIKVTLINLNHTFPDDIDILVVGPTGANLLLMSDCGSLDDIFNRTITFDDAAAASLPDSTILQSGAFKPTNFGTGDTFNAPAPAPSANTTLAAAFGGTAPNGTWSLYLVDDLGIDMGALGNGWGLTITTTGSPATFFSNDTPIHGGDGGRGRSTPYASTINVTGLTGAITDVNVTLTNLNHLNPDDLDIVLVGPRGKRIFLTSDAGGTTDVVSANVTFDDAGAAIIPDAGPMVTGTVKPTNFATGDTMPDIPILYPHSSTAGTATLASVFNGTEPNGTWSLYICDDLTGSAGNVMGGWSLDITAGGTYGARRFTSADFDGDGRSDRAIFRPPGNAWYLRNSSNFNNKTVIFGDNGDIMAPGDYDGDGKTDQAMFRPNTATWYIYNSGSSTYSIIPWGLTTDKPVAADYDGDGKTDIAVWRSSDGNWYIRQSATTTLRAVHWGNPMDTPLTGHFEGTDGADFAVFRSTENNWYILNNAGSSSRTVTWGISGDKQVQADYDGDGKTDIAIFRPSVADWFIIPSTTGTPFIVHGGQTGDIAVPGDYDGDSKADLAVYRNGGWFMNNSGTPTGAASLTGDNWGVGGDIPLGAAYLPPQ